MAFGGAGHFIQYYGSLTSGSFYSVMVLLVEFFFLFLFFYSIMAFWVASHFIQYHGSLTSGSFYTVLWLFEQWVIL